jgi:DNA-binding NtrC family response regulator
VATLLIVDKNEESRDHISRFFNGLDYSVSPAPDYDEAIRLLGSRSFDVALIEVEISGGDIRSLIKAIRRRDHHTSIIVMHADSLIIQDLLGTAAKEVFRVLQKPFYDAELNFQVKRALEGKLKRDDSGEKEDSEDIINKHSEFIGQCSAIQKVFRIVGRIAKTDSSIIILGETGTGKELVAWTIHNDSLRAEGPFVKVNCAALPDQLLESELFGYEKGAFTGADKTRVGRFEYAYGGTIFLDEVADMSLVTQAKLLRVLQQKEFERLGSNISIKTDVRIISATNKNLISLMRQGLFREDLFFRLNVITIRLPPLRERDGDIGLLLQYFLKQSTARSHRQIRGFKQDALEMLIKYPWPGNIREMENTLARAVLLAESDMIGVDDLDLLFAGDYELQARPDDRRSDIKEPGQGLAGLALQKWQIALPLEGIGLAEAERQLIEQALERCGGNQRKAATLLGISSRVLNYKLRNTEKNS